MMMKTVFYRFILLSVFYIPLVHAIDADVETRIKQLLANVVPGEEVTRIRPTPFKDLYEVLLGTEVLYISGDGRYILKGDMLDMQVRENLSENQRSVARKEILDSLSNKDFIEFSPEHPEHLIYVFTDVDCAYCRKLHRDVPVLNKNGIGVRYLAYPRGGMDTNASRVMEAVWCANDRQQALTDAKNDKRIEAKQCNNPVAQEYELGRKLGIRGTPAIFTDQGEALRGYVTPSELISFLKGNY